MNPTGAQRRAHNLLPLLDEPLAVGDAWLARQRLAAALLRAYRDGVKAGEAAACCAGCEAECTHYDEDGKHDGR